MSGFVDALGVVSTIGSNGGHSTVDLPEQGGDPSAITRSATGQIRGNDLASACVKLKVLLPPGSVLRWLPQIADVNPEASAVDDQVDRAIVRVHTKRDLTKRPEPPRQGRVIGNGNPHLELSASDRRNPSVCLSGG